MDEPSSALDPRAEASQMNEHIESKTGPPRRERVRPLPSGTEATVTITGRDSTDAPSLLATRLPKRPTIDEELAGITRELHDLVDGLANANGQQGEEAGSSSSGGPLGSEPGACNRSLDGHDLSVSDHGRRDDNPIDGDDERAIRI